MPTYATLADIEDRHPSELIMLAADETTGLRSDARIERALADATAQIRGVLKARYSTLELERIDADSREMLKVYAIDIALYRIALSFSRSNERIRERYEAALKRLEAIASGKGALSFDSGGGTDPTSPAGGASASPNEVLIDAPAERRFSVRRMGRL
ncbi:DUF1320 domain-containing protein [Methylopila sp. M107]|uniref:gp436 family protein n=1 Tax=Methylopila sp. M107 TaxID=1101190 RepID=UPI00037F6371|nr:DUF1320 domain-containing protein [Methylopila sp. M107]